MLQGRELCQRGIYTHKKIEITNVKKTYTIPSCVPNGYSYCFEGR